MANYYNLTLWRHTGFNFYNRPLSPEVLSQEYFVNPTNYSQVDGITVNRADMSDLKYIDVQGSVKDYSGEQINPPNGTGSRPLGGPWYSLEEVDYLRLVRTGYPGDTDYVDITDYMLNPWEAPHSGKLFIGYYFVTGLEPMARDVTRVYVQMDEWLSMGGAEQIEIESGYKVRGHITESEDAAGYNMASENIAPSYPLETKSHQVIQVPGASNQSKEFLVSSINLTQYSEEMSVDAFVAQAVSGQSVAFPAIQAVHYGGEMVIDEPGTDGAGNTNRRYNVLGFAMFDAGDSRVQHNLSVLYSAGQLELQDSYSIPAYMVSAEAEGGRYNNITSKSFSVKPSIRREMAYPRKADYMLGREILYSLTTGDMNVQPFSEINDDTIKIWAVVSPTGSPYARFASIKNHPYIYDQAVQGMTWVKKAVVLQGASGSMWNQVNNTFAQQSQNRAEAQNASNINYSDKMYNVKKYKQNVDTGIAGASIIASAGSIRNLASGGAETFQAMQLMSDAVYNELDREISRAAELRNRDFTEQSLEQAQNQINARMLQQSMQAPLAKFIPDVSRQVFMDNAFAVYIINISSQDRERFRNYFLRYGYNGLYKKLTWDEINVKQKVNYIECEGVLLKHKYYSQRVTMRVGALLQGGLFLWNEKPSQEAFQNNPDN